MDGTVTSQARSKQGIIEGKAGRAKNKEIPGFAGGESLFEGTAREDLCGRKKKKKPRRCRSTPMLKKTRHKRNHLKEVWVIVHLKLRGTTKSRV